MFRETLIEIFSDIWPMIFIFSVVLASIRIAYIYINQKKVILYKELLTLFFIIYILCLFHVVTFQDVTWSSSNIIPFKEMFRYEFGSRLFYKNVIGNMIMFLPYGFFVAQYIKTKKIPLIIYLVFIASITIEATQLWIGRVFDIDDIILNIVGGILGYYIYRLANAIREKLPKILKNEGFYNIMFLALIVLCILYLSKIINIGG